MTGEATLMAKEPGSVSPYLLRRLRSYQEALRDRITRRRQHRQGQDRPADPAAEAPKPPQRAGSESDRDA